MGEWSSLARWAAGAIALYLFTQIIGGYFSANFRSYLQKRGHDQHFNQIASVTQRVMMAGWPTVKRQWWVWLCLGASLGIGIGPGGFASIISTFTGSRPDAPAPAGPTTVGPDGLDLTFAGAKQRLQDALSKLGSANSKVDELKKSLADIQNRLDVKTHELEAAKSDSPGIGPITTINTISAAGDLWQHLSPGTAVLITNESQENDGALHVIQATIVDGVQTFKTGPVGKVLRAPNYQQNVNAPKLTASGATGIIIHGAERLTDKPDELINLRFKNALSCFVVHFTQDTASGLEEFYQVPKVLWIEIGRGSPWRPRTGAERRTCGD
jgi:hypothetical protein